VFLETGRKTQKTTEITYLGFSNWVQGSRRSRSRLSRRQQHEAPCPSLSRQPPRSPPHRCGALHPPSLAASNPELLVSAAASSAVRQMCPRYRACDARRPLPGRPLTTSLFLALFSASSSFRLPSHPTRGTTTHPSLSSPLLFNFLRSKPSICPSFSLETARVLLLFLRRYELLRAR